MKKNNNAWIVYVVALIAIVALILAAVAINKANMTGQGIFEWLEKSPPNEVNANSCSADEICEMNGAQIGSVNAVQNTMLHIESDNPNEVKSILKNNYGNAWLMLLAGAQKDPYISFQSGNGYWWSIGIDGSESEMFKISQASGLGNNDRLIFKPQGYTIFTDYPTQFEGLAGPANAYACLDNQGVLYRSTSPCI